MNLDHKTIQDARNFIRGLRSAIAFAEAVEEIGTVDTELSAIREAHRTANIALDAQREHLAALRMEQNQILEMIETAKAEAKRIVKDAKEKVASLEEAAKSKAAAECESMLSDARIAASTWDQKARAFQKTVADRRAELEEVEKQLASTKEAMQKLFAGVQNGSV